MDTKTLKAKFTPKLKGKPIAVERQLGIIRYSPKGKYLIGGGFEGAVARWETSGDALTPMEDLTGHHGWIQAAAFHPGGKLLYSGDSWGMLCAWNHTEKKPTPLWKRESAHQGWIRRIAVQPQGKSLASCSSDGMVRIWSPEKGEMIREWEHRLDVLSLTYQPDGNSLVFGDLKGDIHQYDLTSGKLLRRYEVKEMYRLDRIQDVGGVRCLAFDSTGKTLAVGGSIPTTGGFVQGTALLVFFDETGKRIQSLKIGGTNEGYIYDLHWHSAGFVMGVSSGQPGVGKLIFHRPGDTEPFFLAKNMANCHALAVHPEGKRLLVQATNANSAGNGRLLTKEKKYPGNTSPLYVWQIPAG